MTCGERDRVGPLGFFPFEDAFEDVVDGVVALKYLDLLEPVLQSVVQVFESVQDESFGASTLSAFVYVVAAQSRVAFVRAYWDVAVSADMARAERLGFLRGRWAEFSEEQRLFFSPRNADVELLLFDVVSDVWRTLVVDEMPTASYCVRELFPVVNSLRFRLVNGAWVEAFDGVALGSVVGADLAAPVIGHDLYRVVMAEASRLSLGKKSPRSVLDASYSEPVLAQVGSSSDKFAALVWVALGGGQDRGYCYQRLLPPKHRLDFCALLGRTPLVYDVMCSVGQSVQHNWAGCSAQITGTAVLHVSKPGDYDPLILMGCSSARIGADDSDGSPTDYYALGLVDDFFKRHRPPPDPLEQVAPVDSRPGVLTLEPGPRVGRGFVDAARMLYGAIGETLSPRAEDFTSAAARGSYGGDDLDPVDSERVHAVYSRLSSGAVIPESYFADCRSRWRRSRRRPALGLSQGCAYHVFEAYPAADEGGLGAWEVDDAWRIPGWTSYVAVLRRGEDYPLSFTSPVDCSDVRMDCSGDGTIEMGDCKTLVRDTVLWFSNSIKFRLHAKSDVTLRVSVPEAGSAQAFPLNMRRYSYVPGYAVVSLSFEVIVSRPSVTVELKRLRRSLNAGCCLYEGGKFLERGRHRIKLQGLGSSMPVKLVLTTQPRESFVTLSANGIRLRPRARDHVTVLVDPGNVNLSVEFDQPATLQLAALQVASEVEFDLTVASLRAI